MNKKVLNVLLTIIVILIVFVFSSFFYMYMVNDGTTTSVYDEVSTNININSTAEEMYANSDKVDGSENNVLEYDTEKLLPFTGAFPGVDIIALLAEKGDEKEFSNEQILRLGFAKVTKEDWVDSYIGEGEPVSIPASVLDVYIKDIFGKDVKYEKASFSNDMYSIDKDVKIPTSSCKVTYTPENDTYVINHQAGDGINENYIKLLEPTASKIKGKVEIELPYVFVVYGDEMVKGKSEFDWVESEMSGFEYIVYANCNYDTKTFSEELGRFTEFDDLANEDGIVDMSEIVNNIAKKDLHKVNKVTFVYESNETNTEYILKEIRK